MDEIFKEQAVKETQKLEKKYLGKLEKNFDLNRGLVSFQNNKAEAQYRWYKFKEGFSLSLIKYCVQRLNIKPGKLLDPFAGSGASLFAGAEMGFHATGIELLPIGNEVMKVRKTLLGANVPDLVKILDEWIKKKPWLKSKKTKKIHSLKITDGAFPPETKKQLGQYLHTIDSVKNNTAKRLLHFALMCILEEVSFTRKDGQYLRWDYRSGRRPGAKPFDKGEIKDFEDAILSKLQQIKDDLTHVKQDLFSSEKKTSSKNVEILEGSCLDVLPKLKSNSFNFIITSPPYCNRYDYTRTYALELALLGVDETRIRELRQTMLSCTVENRDKENLDKRFNKTVYKIATNSFDSQKALQAILKYLEHMKSLGELNNSGIARMVKNYFYELDLVITECARTMKKNAHFVMVNDNVRYAGVTIPVDLILSDFAEAAGLATEKIWVLPVGKGNSSQQMGNHGREEVRKCVYVWKKL